MDVVETIKTRRSCRRFTDEDVPREMLERIIEAGRWAPSNMNLQLTRFVVVRGEARNAISRFIERGGRLLRKRLEEGLPEKVVSFTMGFFQDIGGAPIIILVYIPRYQAEITLHYGENREPSLEEARFDAIGSACAAIQNMCLAATALGLGSCWITVARRVARDIDAFLGIEDMEMVAGLAIGYAAKTPPVPLRKGDRERWIGFDEDEKFTRN